MRRIYSFLTSDYHNTNNTNKTNICLIIKWSCRSLAHICNKLKIGSILLQQVQDIYYSSTAIAIILAIFLQMNLTPPQSLA